MEAYPISFETLAVHDAAQGTPTGPMFEGLGEAVASPRERILVLIHAEPGVHGRSIARQLGLSRGTTTYHLHVLERRGDVVGDAQGRYRRYFARSDGRIHNKDAIHVLSHPTAQDIAELVDGRPDVIQKEVCASLGISPSRASWHLRRLVGAGVVVAQRRGQRMHYAAGPEWHEVASALPERPAAAC